MDLLRLRWVDGRVAAGLGEPASSSPVSAKPFSMLTIPTKPGFML
jgi:hypothetical protein